MNNGVIKRDKGSLSPSIGKNFEHNIVIKILLDNILIKESFFLYQYFLDIAFFNLIKKEVIIIESKSTIQEKLNITISFQEIIKKFNKIIDNYDNLSKCNDYHDWNISHWFWTNKRIVLFNKEKELDTKYIDKILSFPELSKNVQNHFYEEILKEYSNSVNLKNILEKIKFNVDLKTLKDFEFEIKNQIKDVSAIKLNINLTDNQSNEIHDLIRSILNKKDQEIYDTEILIPNKICDLFESKHSIKTENLINIIKKFDYDYLGNINQVNSVILELIKNSNDIQSSNLKQTIKNLSEFNDYQYILDKLYKTINRTRRIELEKLLKYLNLDILLNKKNIYSQEKLIQLIFDRLFDHYLDSELGLSLYNFYELIIISVAIVLQNVGGK